MNSAIRARVSARVVATAALALMISTPALAGSYTLTDLGASFGNLNTSAYDINNQGDVVMAVGWRGQIYSSSTGTMTSLHETQEFVPVAISNTGYIAGTANSVDPFLYSNGTATLYPGVGQAQGYGYDVNDSGQMVGMAYYRDNPNSSFYTRGYVLDNGVETKLGTLGGQASAAYGINNKGQIVGSAYDSNNRSHVALFENGNVVDLGGPCSSFCRGLDINESGQIAGVFDFRFGPAPSDYRTHAFLYQNGQMIDLGTLGGERSHGAAINGKGQVVGSSSMAGQDPNAFHAFLYDNGSMVDLNSLIDPTLGWILSEASGINDAGQIVGVARVNGQQRAFLLTPTVPVPAAAWLFGSSLAGLWGLARRCNRQA